MGKNHRVAKRRVGLRREADQMAATL